jgi:uncharacterized protein YkwD
MGYRFCLVVPAVALAALPAAGQAVEADDREAVRAARAAPAPAGGPDLAAAAVSIIKQTNTFRTAEGRRPAERNAELAAAADYFAGYMARTGEYGHTADGSKPADRAKKHGYDYCLVAENIAYVFDPAGFTTAKLADQFTTGWKESPGHRKNMLDPDVTETAVAVARSPETGYYYAVQLFGRPKSQAIEFAIANRATAAVEYAIGDKTFTLPPRYTRTHTRCRPGEVTFRRPGGGDKTETVTPAAGDRYVLTPDGDSYRVTKE